MSTEQIAALYRVQGRFVSLYLESPSDRPQAGQELTLRWKNARHELEREGADSETLAAIDRALDVDTDVVQRGPSSPEENRAGTGNKPRDLNDVARDDAAEHAGGDVVAVIAAEGEVLLDTFVPHVRGGRSWRLAALPWVTPLLEAEQARIPYLCVLTDRAGADIVGYGPGGEVADSVEGLAKDRLQKTGQGGWSQRRYEQRAVEAWDQNAQAVAAEVATLADTTGARLIGVGGDVHAVRLLQEHLPERLRALVRVLERGTRGASLDEELLADELRRLVKTRIAEDTVAVLDRYTEEKGQRDRAADGPAAVVEALQMGLVDTLLVHDDGSDGRTAWFGPEPLHLALTRDDVAGMGVEIPIEGRLVDVAVRAAVGGGAQVRVVPASVVTDGVGALLRAPQSVRPGT
jgi:hypothetical protein